MGLILKQIWYKTWDQMLCFILGLYFDRSVVLYFDGIAWFYLY